jgi:agmatinase
MAVRAVVDVLGTLVAHGKMGAHQHLIRGWSG